VARKYAFNPPKVRFPPSSSRTSRPSKCFHLMVARPYVAPCWFHPARERRRNPPLVRRPHGKNDGDVDPQPSERRRARKRRACRLGAALLADEHARVHQDVVDGDEIAWKASELGDVGEAAGKLGGECRLRRR
jgi:hypothetical protein